MHTDGRRFVARAAWLLALSLVAASGLYAQTRVALPEGTVILVRTERPLDSATAQQGQTFETTVVDTVQVDGYPAIPAGSQVQGVVTFVQAADRRNSGVMAVEFNRLVLPGGASVSIDGRLTSTDPAERRQIESDPDAHVVLVGERGGIGAAIAGAGSTGDPVSGILGTLGTLLSEGRDVRVPAGTQLAVQLATGLVIRVQGTVRPLAADAFTIYTATDVIREAQRALARAGYYRGSAHGRLDDATQRALFEYQIDKGILATGNLDGRTAQALGLTVGAGAALTADEASLLRRSAQALTNRYRQEIGVGTSGRLNARRLYERAELELWFALSAFGDNAVLYEQVVRSSGNVEGTALAGQTLLDAARRVDETIDRARPEGRIVSAWETIRQALGGIDSAYLTGR